GGHPSSNHSQSSMRRPLAADASEMRAVSQSGGTSALAPSARENSVQYPLPTRGEASKGIVAVAKGGAHSSASLAAACSSSVKVPDVALLSARNSVTIAMGSKMRLTST